MPEPEPPSGGRARPGAAAVALVVVLGVLVAVLAVVTRPEPPHEQPAAPSRPSGEKGPRAGDDVRLAEGETLLVGTVTSVGGGTLAVARDGGGEVSVGVDEEQERHTGVGRRVVVRVADGRAVRVRTATAFLVGTVTDVEGDRARLVQTDGMRVELDLSGVAERPAATDLVSVSGSVAEGNVVVVDDLRALPRTG